MSPWFFQRMSFHEKDALKEVVASLVHDWPTLETDGVAQIKLSPNLYCSVKSLSGCCGTMHVFDTRFSYSEEDPKLVKVLEKIAVLANYSQILVTHTSNHINTLLLAEGYTVVTQFSNKRSDNLVKVYTKNI